MMNQAKRATLLLFTLLAANNPIHAHKAGSSGIVASAQQHSDIDQVLITVVSHNNNAEPAKLKVTTANNEVILVKASGKDHANTYHAGEAECTVQKGAFNVTLPHSPYTIEYSIEFLYSGKEQKPGTLILRNNRSGAVLLIAEVTDHNSYIVMHTGQNQLEWNKKRSTLIEQHTHFKQNGHLHIMNRKGEAAAAVLAAKARK